MNLPAGFVDLHTHLIPALDDGPPDLATAVAIVRAAAATGTGVMVATSHSAEVLQSGAGRDGLQTMLDAVRDAVGAAGITVTLLLGTEIFLEPDTPARLQSGAVASLNGSRYVLVELPFQSIPMYLDATLFALQAAGFVPVIAHPERNVLVQREPQRLAAWVERGALIQISAASVLGGFGRAAGQVARLAVAHHLCHAVASDAHDPRSRPPQLDTVDAALREEFGPATARRLLDEQPRAIVEDRPLTPPEPLPLDPAGDHGLLRRVFGRA